MTVVFLTLAVLAQGGGGKSKTLGVFYGQLLGGTGHTGCMHMNQRAMLQCVASAVGLSMHCATLQPGSSASSLRVPMKDHWKDTGVGGCNQRLRDDVFKVETTFGACNLLRPPHPCLL